MPKNPLLKYLPAARKWAFIRALDRGYTPQDTTKNPKCIREMIDDCELYQRAQLPTPGLEPAPVRPNVPAPGRVPPSPNPPTNDIFQEVARVGVIRGLYLVAGSGDGWGLTLKLTLPGGQQVYRYGRLRDPAQIEEVLRHWLAKPRWIQDKQKTRDN